MIGRRSGGRGLDPRTLTALGAALVLSLGVGGRDLARAETEWNQVILIYQTDCKGEIDPCG